jgi:hypothetical protein
MSRPALRLVVVDEPEVRPGGSERPASGGLRCTYRLPGDDFFCWKFQIWYPSIDCAYRVKHRTCAPCSNCAQGRRNLERREVDLAQRRWIGDPPE